MKNIYFHNNGRGYISLLLLLFFTTLHVSAHQDTLRRNTSIEFQLFAKAGFNDEKSKTIDFDHHIDRTLLVYKQSLSNKFLFCLAGDSYSKNKEKPYELRPFLKRVYIQYHNKKMSLTGGLLVLEQFKYQRKLWRLIYIEKTFQYKCKYGDNRNVGVLMKYKLSNRFSYDVALTSGFSTPSKDSHEKYTVMTGQTFNAGQWGIRFFNSVSVNPYFSHVISLFVAKQLQNGVLGLELANKTSDNKQTKEDKLGASVFGNYHFTKSLMCFARYDVNKQQCDRSAVNVIYAGVEHAFKDVIHASVFYKKKFSHANFYGVALLVACF
ncbi:hypothetical protein EYV94_00050 [Puteibacter caeruleilacunae]|nr:hypothetical protein EYV94_00050 [Puteibacter caeruleilacunae]